MSPLETETTKLVGTGEKAQVSRRPLLAVLAATGLVATMAVVAVVALAGEPAEDASAYPAENQNLVKRASLRPSGVQLAADATLTALEWKVTQVRGNTDAYVADGGTCDVDDCRMQVNEVRFFDYTGASVDMQADFVITATGSSNDGQGIENIYDFDLTTPFLDQDFGKDGSETTITFTGSAAPFAFEFATGRTWLARDPTQWTWTAIYSDGTKAVVSQMTAFNGTEDREAWAGPGVIAPFVYPTTSPDPCGQCINMPIPDDKCPSKKNLPNCEEVDFTSFTKCEGDNECGTTNALNNCGDYDIYEKQCSTCGDGCMLIALTFCPSGYDSFPNCEDLGAVTGYCEGDGECDTTQNLNNCGNYDVYEKVCTDLDLPLACNDSGCTLFPIPSSDCPSDPDLDNCEDASYGSKYCEGDGECGTTNALNNCGDYDVYYRSC